MEQRGFSLVETAIAAAIVALLAAAAIGLGAGARPLAARTAATQFDAALSAARAIAAGGSNGATLVVTGSEMTIFSGRPSPGATLSPAPVAPLPLRGAAVTESALGPAPLALFIDSEGRVTVSAFTGATPAPMETEPACPASGAWQIRFSDARSTAARTLACSSPAGSP